MTKREWKSYPLLEFKADAEKGHFSGYASTYTKDAYGDVIQPGAFAQSIVDQKGMVPMFMNHDDDNWIGFATDLVEDQKGLLMQGKLELDTIGGANAYALLKMADALDFRVGLSIGFIADDYEWDDATGARLISAIDLWEISITPFPANKRAFVDDVKSVRNFEKRLRDVGGFSVGDSKRILALLNGPLPTARAADQPLAPVRDAQEVQISAVPAPALTGIRRTLWEQVQRL